MRNISYFLFAAITIIGISSCKNSSNPAGPVNYNGSLVAWYKLDQNAADSSGNGNNGTAQGGVFVPDRFGSAQSALSLDGQSSFISVPNTAKLNFDSSSSYTISVWVKTASSATAGIVSKGPVKGLLPGYSIGMNKGSAEIQISSLDNIDLTSSAKINDNKWHMITLTVDSHGGVILYIDGAPDQKGLSLGMFPDRNNTAPFFIGKDRLSSSFYSGAIDDIRLYEKVLTASEITTLYSFDDWSSPIDTSHTGTGNFITDSIPNPGFSTTVSSSQHLDGSSCPPWNVAYGAPWIVPGAGSDGTKGYLYMWGTSDDGCAVLEPLMTPIKKGHIYHVKCMLKLPSGDLHNTPYGRVRFLAFNQAGSGIPWQISSGQIASLGAITISKIDSWDPYTTLDWTADANYTNLEIDVQNGNSGGGFETWVAIDNIQLQEKQ